mmetsp:Transcript_25561/g.64392  ORF Transcript_25561/g.64392 Transcript_25561/m.64392 type:complete len:230 (-) Transcript_25561:324-1013(-)
MVVAGSGSQRPQATGHAAFNSEVYSYPSQRQSAQLLQLSCHPGSLYSGSSSQELDVDVVVVVVGDAVVSGSVGTGPNSGTIVVPIPLHSAPYLLANSSMISKSLCPPTTCFKRSEEIELDSIEQSPNKMRLWSPSHWILHSFASKTSQAGCASAVSKQRSLNSSSIHFWHGPGSCSSVAVDVVVDDDVVVFVVVVVVGTAVVEGFSSGALGSQMPQATGQAAIIFVEKG